MTRRFLPLSHNGSFAVVLLVALRVPSLAAGGGSVTGTVRDATGAVIPGAVVSATNTDNGVRSSVITNSSGVYAFSSLVVGHYDVEVAAANFKPYRRAGVFLDIDSARVVDVVLEVGQSSETITVNEAALRPETASPQLGDVIRSASLTSEPLNGRSYTDLLALQGGVVPVTTITALTVQGLGQNIFSPSGDLNPGTLSINGQRESANGFTINGADAEETGSLAAAIIPNLDSIAEFRIVSANFGAEYGRYTGGQIDVITKSGGNRFHGNAFEFLRNTDLDARNYFSPTRGSFIQNQFGGTAGGPIRKNRSFFFVDYQGTRQIQGSDTGLIPVPSLENRTGNLSDEASSLTGTVSGPYWANLLTEKLGYAVSTGEPYYTSGCISPAQCVLPNATIPKSAWSAPALALLQYIPTPNLPGNLFSTSAYNEILRDDKTGERLDANTAWGVIFGYYSFDNYRQNNPYPTAQGGASVPGFNALNAGSAQLAIFGDTKTFGANAVNELRISYTRDANDLGKPIGGLGVSLTSQGFVTGPSTLGIVPLAPQEQGVENIFFNNFTIGSDPDQFDQINNDFELRNSYSRVIGTHSLKFGGQVDYDQINTHPYADLNGSFNFYGTETGLDFADFLLGVASQYTQNDLRPFYGRDKYAALFAQDTWRATRGLTLNYGVRWDRIEPWYEKYNNIITLVPGEQSEVFPTAPTGIVYPGDPGISRTLAPPGNRDFAPRVGLAYSPDSPAGSRLGALTGGPGKTSIRAGFGIFYAAIQGETMGLISDNAPYGFTYTSPAPPLFATPFVDAATGNIEGQRFPAQIAPLNVSRENPDTTLDFSQFEPIGAIPGYKPTNKIPYTDSYVFSLQRQVRDSMLVTVSYVGNQGHRLLVLEEANPGNPALCLSLSQVSDVAPGSPTCGPFGENTIYITASGQTVNGTRGPFGPSFGSISYQTSIGNSSFNALEASFRYSTARAQALVSYTYSKSIDQSSNLGEEVDPFDPNFTRGLSSFDIRQNLVASFTYSLAPGKSFVAGWSISGITRFSTGLPVTFYNYEDTSLLGTQGNGINNLTLDQLQMQSGPLDLSHNPRNGQPYFNTALFSLPQPGSLGNSGRRRFSGPGMANFDLALQRTFRPFDFLSCDLRLEAFNVLNHAQFFGTTSVDGNISSPTFGQVVSAAAPRLLQVALKLLF